jgi:hypothetical protein
VPALRLHPAADLAARVAQPVHRREDLEQPRLVGGAVAEVAAHRVGDRVCVLDENPLDLREVLPALSEAGKRMSAMGLALQDEDALRLVLDALHGS